MQREPWEREREAHQQDVEARKERARRRRKKRGRDKLEREFAVARRRRGRKGKHAGRGRELVTGPAACPACGDGDRLFEIERVAGICRGSFRFETGVVRFEGDGYTEVDWDSISEAGVGCDCGWRGRHEELVPAA